MDAFEQSQISLSTGVTLNVATAGQRDGEAIIFLHGFPESHRTWRHQIAALSDRYFCIAPDQRGYAKSEKPEGVESYTVDKLTADIVALADAFDIDRFILAGHDWGGAIAWAVALGRSQRVSKLIIANAPHPMLYQLSLYEDRDQREAATYIGAFRQPDAEHILEKHGLQRFLEQAQGWTLNPKMPPEERAIQKEDWERPGAALAMVNWYRATPMQVPAPDEDFPRPRFLDTPMPKLKMSVLVTWGIDDHALMPRLYQDLDDYIDDLTLVTIDAGHFVPWEAPEAVNAAIEGFLR